MKSAQGREDVHSSAFDTQENNDIGSCSDGSERSRLNGHCQVNKNLCTRGKGFLEQHTENKAVDIIVSSPESALLLDL